MGYIGFGGAAGHSRVLGHNSRGTFLEVPIIRTMVYWGLYWSALILGNYQVGTKKHKGCCCWIVIGGLFCLAVDPASKGGSFKNRPLHVLRAHLGLRF